LGDFLIRPNFRAFFLGKSDASFLTENWFGHIVRDFFLKLIRSSWSKGSIF
jgi:hypothetical protein